jgi:trimeric autotransporter adhesin
MKLRFWFLPLMLVVVVAGCAKPPKAEIDAAEAAVARASQSPDVVAYAPEELQRAKKALDQMRSEVAARHFDKAKAAAIEAKAAADGAIAAAPANKEKAKIQAGDLIAAVKSALPQARALLAKASRVKKASVDVAGKAAELEGASASLAEAESAFDQGDYRKAIEKAESAQKTIADIEGEIGSSVQASTRKK